MKFPRKIVIELRGAESAARSTLTTILPKAAYLPALDSLLQHCMFVGPIKPEYSEFKKEQKDMTAASLKYLTKAWNFILPT